MKCYYYYLSARRSVLQSIVISEDDPLVIVDIDQECEATDDWYYGNQSQPSRQQAWYHVLVHGSDQVTYVAQSNLMKDFSKEKMNHPLVSYFFRKTKEGHYIRNSNPWPETDF